MGLAAVMAPPHVSTTSARCLLKCRNFLGLQAFVLVEDPGLKQETL